MGRSGFLAGAGVSIASAITDHFVNELESNLQQKNEKLINESRSSATSGKSIIAQKN